MEGCCWYSLTPLVVIKPDWPVVNVTGRMSVQSNSCFWRGLPFLYNVNGWLFSVDTKIYSMEMWSLCAFLEHADILQTKEALPAGQRHLLSCFKCEGIWITKEKKWSWLSPPIIKEQGAFRTRVAHSIFVRLWIDGHLLLSVFFFFFFFNSPIVGCTCSACSQWVTHTTCRQNNTRCPLWLALILVW